MSRKTFLPATCCLLFFSFSAAITFPQQNKAERGKLLMTESRPSDGGTASRIDRFRRSWYRTYDGRNNNITSEENAYWGAADIPLYRELPAAYASSDPKNALGG